MKYFISNIYDGCWYQRCYLPMLYNGFSGDKESFSEHKDRLKDTKMVMSADTIIFQRPDEENKLASAILLQKAGKKIVFENDDTYKLNDAMKLKGLNQRVKTLDAFIKMADLVTTTTEYLAKEYRKLNDNVVVLPNYINPDDWSKPKRSNGKVRIGIFGSATLNKDSEVIEDILKDLSQRKDVQLVVMGVRPPNIKGVKTLYKDDLNFWSKLNVENHYTVMIEDYFDALNDLKLDIVLIPRQDNYFNRCKSNLKFLEASMLEIPVIAQGFSDHTSPYESFKDKKWMFIAQTKKDWSKAINRLINDENRQKIGQRAKKYVLENYNIKNNYYKWADAYKTI